MTHCEPAAGPEKEPESGGCIRTKTQEMAREIRSCRGGGVTEVVVQEMQPCDSPVAEVLAIGL